MKYREFLSVQMVDDFRDKFDAAYADLLSHMRGREPTEAESAMFGFDRHPHCHIDPETVRAKMDYLVSLLKQYRKKVP